MKFMHWNDEKMAIGIKLIDDQHKEFLKIINKLSTSIHRHSQKKDIVTIVEELINYATYHFKIEEELFEKFQFEEMDNHKKEHDLFTSKFLELKDRVSNDELYLKKHAIDIASDTFQFIINWFLEHIVGSDKKYAQLLKDNGIK